MNERINELLLLSLSHNDCYLPFGMRRSSRSLSKLLKLAAKAWVILRDVPGVRGGTWDGRSNGQVQVVVKVVVVQSLSWENKQDSKKNRQLSLEKNRSWEKWKSKKLGNKCLTKEKDVGPKQQSRCFRHKKRVSKHEVTEVTGVEQEREVVRDQTTKYSSWEDDFRFQKK